VEAGEDGKGRGALFCSLSSSSEKSTAIIMPEGTTAKVIDSTKPPVFEATPGQPTVMRGIHIGIRKPTVIMLRFPLSAIGDGGLTVFGKRIERMTEEVQNDYGHIKLRRFISSDEKEICIGMKCFERAEFENISYESEGFETDEWAFIRFGCKRCHSASAVANLFWPVSENGEIKTDEINSINWRQVEGVAALLYIAPRSKLSEEHGN
jgi:hypothetical protein